MSGKSLSSHRLLKSGHRESLAPRERAETIASKETTLLYLSLGWEQGEVKPKIDARVQLGYMCVTWEALRRAVLRITVLRYRCLKRYTGGRDRKFEVVVSSTRFMCRECLT